MTYFADVPPVRYEGPESRNPLAFRFYDKNRLVLGKRMEDHLRWAVSYWHSFNWPGSDVFGAGTFERPWAPGQPVTPDRARLKLDAAFDFFSRLGAPFFCFHDVDAIGEFASAADYTQNLATVVDAMEAKIAETGTKLLWGTANLFGHPRYAAGAATNPRKSHGPSAVRPRIMVGPSALSFAHIMSDMRKPRLARHPHASSRKKPLSGVMIMLTVLINPLRTHPSGASAATVSKA